MAERLEAVSARFRELEEQLSDPTVTQDLSRFEAISREHAQLRELNEVFVHLKAARAAAEEARQLSRGETEPDMVEFLRAELENQETRTAQLTARLQVLLLPRDPNDDKDVVVEVRAGTGGDEAALFAADLFNMYSRFAERRRWQVELIDISGNQDGGFKEAVFEVRGQGAYSQLKYESGVHRVQRVPKTESQGRIHTSAASVVVMPEADAVEVDIRDEDLEWDVFRSTGPGGQSVNTTDSAVRVTHKPSGLVVTCQDEKSQHKNKAKALKVLAARLYDLQLKEHQEKLDQTRRSAVRSGDRSEKIRTYNFPENRITDHRIDLKLYRLAQVLEGDLDEVVQALSEADQAERLARGDSAALASSR
ncbi:MAG: peptide chain release factor 1 [Candidatus Dormibacteria bacterium]